ncbi:uncharacterized protein E0L32_011137 [Thyridium curvatum]|uniref:(S)-2-hydroxy-acid oxidase n=1 Tax=Thyridium curvatum TaxID=1093900 RepID=A0A507AID9_9PEZI|nr:uncharacterized protein E0L32_011137 [Thyridium curvatum]TPX06913.1 hypothetical protein E0L32_011137 [Thyridium curvatum]
MSRMLSAQEVQKHNNPDDLWIAVDGNVYDMTEFTPDHPGGPEIILRHAGGDASAAYNEVHGPSLIKDHLPAAKHIGSIDASTLPPPQRPQPTQQQQQPSLPSGATSSQPPAPPSTKPPLSTLISAHDFAAAASRTFTPKAWAFASSAATDLHTLRANAGAYAAVGLRPRVLVDVSGRADTSARFLGRRARLPLFASPTSMGRQFHPEGEREVARGCAAAGVPQCVSTSASFPLREIVAAGRERSRGRRQQQQEEQPVVYFQLYVDRDRRRSEALLREAAAQGAAAVFLTVDAPVPGKREADERVQLDAAAAAVATPMTGLAGTAARGDAKGGALGRIMARFIDDSVSWRDVAWIRRTVPGVPVVLKGVQTWMDAVAAAEAGVDGIVLSNHGGRSLDTSPAPLLVLLELHRNCPAVFDRLEVFVDGGITRGTDIFKALCLGAKAVGVGRGILYGVNYGEEGIVRYIDRRVGDDDEDVRRDESGPGSSWPGEYSGRGSSHSRSRDTSRNLEVKRTSDLGASKTCHRFTTGYEADREALSPSTVTQ